MIHKTSISSLASVDWQSGWIVHSGATCHMCNDKRLFIELHNLEKPQEVALGDGHDVEAIGRGVVVFETKLPSGRTRKCQLHEVVYVPKLSYNLFSISKASNDGKSARFRNISCQILDNSKRSKLIAVATRMGDLHYLDCHPVFQMSHTASNKVSETKEVYMKQTEGFAEEGQEYLTCKLRKSIYGLKLLSWCWNLALDTHLKQIGIEQAEGDPCLYMSSEREYIDYGWNQE